MECRFRTPSRSNSSSSTNAHVLLLPFPSQGHVAPFMKLSHKLTDLGINVTLMITEFIHKRMITELTLPRPGEEVHPIGIVAVPDGLGPEDNRGDVNKLSESFFRILPGHMEDLINKVSQSDGDAKVTCVIADPVMVSALEVADKMRIKKATFFTSSPGVLTMILQLPKLIEAGIINTKGTATKNEKIQLSPTLPPLSDAEFIWKCPEYKSMEEIVFQCTLSIDQNMRTSNWILCNWFNELDPSVECLIPNILTIGPLLGNGRPTGNFWPQDLTCLSWLDTQSPNSVIYVSFGSTSIFSQQQFQELALGLELSGRPFLWVVRADATDGVSPKYPEMFIEKVGNLGKIIEWAPQEKVLAHPSVLCFFTHCGWNSTIEGISMGVPLLCWPYLSDQFYNRSCVCDGWKVGLGLDYDDNGIITRHEIKKKLDELIGSDDIRTNALKLKEQAQNNLVEGGSSWKNLEQFVTQIML
ncbi:hypothetical protein HS088_TW11G00456 [Tripterygium wilfordii]|uniref:Glycosyltransferase n=1 Tax=Tripterygium wilfordii TaxID=458696 RepID=A0A7J7D211_TRIWF|nr:UDP-glycosyltransferase 83A1-like [Tripterygium wilfordii]KAF5740387.1 hypothetical protein HS088_TW11G00456 [Tripterygium wilfordii]